MYGKIYRQVFIILHLSIFFCFFILPCGLSRTPHTPGSFCSCKCWKGTGKGKGEGTGKGERKRTRAGKRTRTWEGENHLSPCWTLSPTRWGHMDTLGSLVLYPVTAPFMQSLLANTIYSLLLLCTSGSFCCQAVLVIITTAWTISQSNVVPKDEWIPVVKLAQLACHLEHCEQI